MSKITFDDLEDPYYNISNAERNKQKQKPKTLTKEGNTVMQKYHVIEGTLNFSNLTKTDTFNGQDTGKFNVTITIDEEGANKLSSQGVKVKDYQGNKQRKFQTQYDVTVLDAENNRYKGEVPYNSMVRVKYALGNEHPVHGVTPYLQAVKVLEEAEIAVGEDSGDF